MAKKIKKIYKNKNKDNKKHYPVRVDYDNGSHILIPDNHEFGSFCQKHGCSMTAASIALQFLGVKQKDDTAWNPDELYTYAKKHVAGYNRSKLTVYGTKVLINKLAGGKRAKWYPITGRNNRDVKKRIRRALRAGKIVIFEQRNPIHSVVFLGFNEKGDKVLIATYGKVQGGKLNDQINKKALHGCTGVEKQQNWFKGASYGAGYTIVG
nr:MAG TPA: peptidase [Caudoviricetes sp.]